jgi:trigger factor
MQVSVETTNTLQRRITVAGIPKERIEPEIQNRLKSLAQKAKVNGFRPGKVPLRVVDQKYGNQVRQEVIGEVIRESFNTAMQQEKLRPIGEPSFDLITDLNDLEQGLSYTATFEIYPELPSLNTSGLTIEKPTAKVSEADIDKMILRLQQQRQTWHTVDRPATKDDRLVIDFSGTINGAPFKNNQAKQIPLFLSQKNGYLPNLEEKLIGARANQDYEVDLVFPEDYPHAEELKGQTVHFQIYVNSVAEPHLPELNAEFAKSFGVEDGSLETLRQDAKANMERELEYAIKNQVKHHVLEALLQANPIEVPPSLVTEEVERLKKTLPPQSQKVTEVVNMLTEQATKRVKLGLLLSEIVSQYQIQVDPDKVRQIIERIAFAYEDSQSVINSYYSDKQRLKEVESIALEDQLVEWLLTRSQPVEKESDFYTIMEQSSMTTVQKT